MKKNGWIIWIVAILLLVGIGGAYLVFNSADTQTVEPVATAAAATQMSVPTKPATKVPATKVPATKVPATKVPATKVPATADNLGVLDYQDDPAGGCAASAQPEQYPACWLQRAQSQDSTVSEAVGKILALAGEADAIRAVNFSSWEIHPHQPALVYCPAGDCLWPPDTAFPLQGSNAPEWSWLVIGVVQAHPDADPAAYRTVTCPAGDCWATWLEESQEVAPGRSGHHDTLPKVLSCMSRSEAALKKVASLTLKESV